MCISARASVNSFFFNLLSVFLLIKYGNENLKPYNVIIGLFSIFTSFMQLIDLMMWLDLDCKTGLNKVASIVGPILNYLQPTIIFILTLFVLNFSKSGHILSKSIKNIKGINKQFTHSNELNFNKLLNIFYIISMIIRAYNYYSNTSKFCTNIVDGHLKWGWSSNKSESIFHPLFYGIVAILNLYSINPNSNYMKLTIILYLSQYFISKVFIKTHVSEIWCLASTSIPIVLLIIQKIFGKYLN